MTAVNIRNLLFSYVPNPRLVKEAIGWDINDRFSDEEVTARFPNKDTKHRRTLKYSDEDHRIVQLIFIMIASLSDATIDARVKKISDLNHKFGAGEFPINLDNLEVDILAKNARWMRYEVSLLAHGFVLGPSSRRAFYNCVIGRKNVKSELLKLPVFESYFILDKQLANSGIFEVKGHANPQNKALSTDISRWLNKMEIPMPDGLENRVKHFFGPENEKDLNNSHTNPKERSSMLILINAMARAKFKFKPNESLGPSKAAIDLAIKDVGLSLSERTIGEYLKDSEVEAERQRDKRQ